MMRFLKNSCVFLFVLSSSALVGGVAATTKPNKKTKKPPHIIVMLVDDAGFADVGFNDGWKDLPKSPTPTMDRNAKKHGLKLDRFYVNPSCTPTRAALLTGRYAWRVGFHEANVLGIGDADCLGRVVDERENNTETLHYVPFEEKSTLGTMKILPELLKEAADYRTHAVGKWHLGFSSTECYPENRGFDSHFGPFNGVSDHYAHTNAPGCFSFRPEIPCPANLNIQGYDLHDTEEPDGVFRIEAISRDTYSTNLFSNRVVRIIDEHDQDKPLFIYYTPTAPHNALQADKMDLNSAACSSLGYDSERKYICAMMKGLDRSVKDITEALSRKGMWENTVFWFMSDNGGVLDFGQDNGDLREGKNSYLEGGIRSASFLAGGRVKKNIMLDQQSFIDVTDVAPTLLGAAGIVHQQPYEFDGQDLSHELIKLQPINGAPSSGVQADRKKNLVNIPGRDIAVTTVRDVELFIPLFGIDYNITTGTIISKIFGRYYKFAITPQRPIGPGIKVRGSEEFLFDIVKDPTESENLVRSLPEIAEEFKFRLLDATYEAPSFKAASRSILNSPSPLQAVPPFRGCVVAFDHPARNDDNFSCLDNLVQLTNASLVDPTFPVPGFGVGTLCLEGDVVGFPQTSCE